MTIQQDLILNIKANNQNISGAIKSATQTASSGGASGGVQASMKGMEQGVKKMNGGMMAGLGGILKTLMPIMGIALGIAGLVMASKSLQRVLGGIGKMLMMFLRPIGDMLSILLMPLLMLIRPLGLFINALLRPYLQDARKAMRTGQRLQKEGDDAGAMEAFGLGAGLLLTGFTKMFINVAGELAKMFASSMMESMRIVVNVFGALGSIIIGALTGSDEAVAAWQETMGLFNNQIDLGKEFLHGIIDVMVELANTGLDAAADNMRNRVNELSKSLEDGTPIVDDNKSALEKLDEIMAKMKGNIDALNASISTTVSTIIISFSEKIFGAMNTEIDATAKKAEEFGAKLREMFPSIFGESKTGAAASEMIGAGMQIGPFDELSSIFEGIVGGDIGGVIQGMVNLLDPLHGLFEMANFVGKTFEFLQIATNELHGFGGHGFVELQAEVSKSIVSYAKNTQGMEIFGRTMTAAINAVNNAVAQAKSFAASAAASAQSAAASANSAAASASRASASSSDSKSSSSGKRANDVILRPNGETIYTNPNDTIFAMKNAGMMGGSSGGNNITFNVNITASDGADMKRKLDEIIRDTMRKYA